MKSLHLVMSVALLSLSTVAFSQTDAQKASWTVPSEGQKSFTTMKTLAGEWEGPVTVREMPEMSGGKPLARLNARDLAGTRAGARDSRSRNAIGCDEVRSSGDDGLPGWRTVNTGSLLRRGEPAAHDWQDVARWEDGGVRVHGHVAGARNGTCTMGYLPMIDANHHTEDWTFMMPGDKPIHAHADLHRVN